MYANQFPNLRSLDHANSNGRLLQSPISIQNQQFSFLPTRGDPFARGQLPVAGNIRALAPTSASFPSPSVVKPTSSRSLSPNFVEIISPSPQRLITSNRVIGGASTGQNQASASNQQGNDRNTAADVQYEYYDENDGDVLYQYGNDFNEPSSNSPSSSSAGNSRQSGQFFTEVSSQQNKQLKNQRTPTSASTSSKRDSTRYAPASSTKPTQGSQQLSSSKSVIPSGTSNRLFRPNRPSPFSSSAAASSTSAQASRETSSSFIPLIDENEEPEQGLALNGRSVQSTSHRGNSLSSSGVRPPSTFLRSSTTAAPPTPSASSSVNSSNSTNTRVRGFYSRTQQSKQAGERNSTLLGSNRRPAVIRGNSNSSTNNRFGSVNAATPPSRAPIIIRPRNLTRSRPNTRAKKGDPTTSSSTYRPDPNIDQHGSSSEKSSIPGNSVPSVEDYTVEYVEYPFNNDDNSSVVEYYEVSEETAQALLQRAKAKAHQRKSLDHSLKPSNNKTSTSTSSRSSSSSRSFNNSNSNSNETATKVTVSVSAKSSYSSTSTTSTTSTTPSPPSPSGGEVSSSEENTSDQVDPSGEVVISVATTKSVSGKKDVTQPPKQLATATPRVTFSRATGSSFVVASVQTSRSVAKPHGHEGRTSKTIHGTVEGLKDNMPSGAETAPEYYEEEYTYPDNYPVLNNDAGSLIRDHEDDEQQLLNQDHYNPHEYSHEVSIQPSVVTPTKSVILESSSSPDYENGVVAPSSTGADSSSNQFKESQEASLKSTVVNDDEHYDDDSGSHAPHHKLPSKNGDIPLKHFETLVNDESELEVDHPLRPVSQGDLSSPPDDEASYHSAAILPSFPTLTTVPTTTTSSPVIFTTTEKPRKDPTSIFSSIRFAEVSPNFLPPGFKLPSSEASSSPEISSSSEASTTTTTSSTTTTSTTTTEATPTERNKVLGIQFQEIDVASLLPKGYKPRPSLSRTSSLPTSTTTEEPSSSTVKTVDPLASLKNIQFKEIAIPGLVPKDYKPTQPEKKEEEEKEPNITSSIAGIRFETPSHLLPSGFKPPVPSPLVPIKFETPSNLLPKGYKPPATVAVEPVEFEIPAHLLPPGYKPRTPATSEATISTSTTPPPPVTVPTTKKSGGLVFPTKSGGFRITRPTSTQAPTGDTPEPPSVRIATGWPTRKTTEFTGWPTTPTTPMPSTASTSTTTTTERPTTTTPTTTTTTPEPKRHPAGTCAHGICRMEATIRIVGGVKWVPEFQDVNTDEYKNLETIIKREVC